METERIDVRKLERAARDQLRRTVVRLFTRGHSQAFIARELGLRRATVAAWVGKARAGLDPQESQRGRRMGTGRRLTGSQEARLRQEIVERTPDQCQLPFALWNAQAVRALIKECFLIQLPVRTVRLYLQRWGFRPQRPLQRAFEQQPVAVQQWLQTDYPRIAARAKGEGAEICWGDETAVSLREHYPRGYAPPGRTPVLVVSQAQRERINLISAVTNQGTVRFMMYPDTLTAAVLIRFLQRLIRDAQRKVFLILDNLRVHHSQRVRTWLENQTNRIEVFFLPRYSPELNPDEYLNCDLKGRMSAAEPARNGTQLKRKVLSHLRSIQKQPARVRAYFRAKAIRYAA